MTNTTAFPHTVKYCIGHDANNAPVYSESNFPGMTLRDYFAAKALSGLLADTDINHPAKEVARLAYNCADAMLLEREKQ